MNNHNKIGTEITTMIKSIGIFIINFTWGAIQTVIGLVAFLALIGRPHYWYKGSIVTVKEGSWGGISLGAFIFIDTPIMKDRATDSDFVNHEYGHSLQSSKLGPLYLIIIGIPSLIWAAFFGNWRRAHKKSYYDFYTEQWADELAGVKRNGTVSGL
ncbi:MAG: hypothetical protein FWD58_02220 [Firmicutes bacterium]|nr:hypothetical protein [Bacillota bacterium]